ncbi:TraB/GumN family protein [Acetobacter nitrogenifigens]|uniref:TraB/GumN family protein n=1 Tax=Acetobacter nitrogenifigens TaxID=285268 RepID=UPI001FEDE9B6|nr:TraB/GumN family protein [Acetobacter nitrogenifigens]
MFLLSNSSVLASVPVVQVQWNNGPVSVIVPAVHAPAQGVTAPAGEIFKNKTVFLREGMKTEDVPELASSGVDPSSGKPNWTGQLAFARWTNDFSLPLLAKALSLHAGCFTRLGQQLTGKAQPPEKYVPVIALNMKTARMAMVVVETPCPAPDGLSRDARVNIEAAKMGLKPVWLENPVEYKRTEDQIPDAAYSEALARDLREIGDNTLTNEMVEVLEKSGDFDGWDRMVRSRASTPALATLLRYMVDERTTEMVTHMEPYLRAGGAVVLVGMGHLGGETGVLSQLRRDHFTVKIVKAPDDAGMAP